MFKNEKEIEDLIRKGLTPNLMGSIPLQPGGSMFLDNSADNRINKLAKEIFEIMNTVPDLSDKEETVKAEIIPASELVRRLKDDVTDSLVMMIRSALDSNINSTAFAITLEPNLTDIVRNLEAIKVDPLGDINSILELKGYRKLELKSSGNDYIEYTFAVLV